MEYDGLLAAYLKLHPKSLRKSDHGTIQDVNNLVDNTHHGNHKSKSGGSNKNHNNCGSCRSSSNTFDGITFEDRIDKRITDDNANSEYIDENCSYETNNMRRKNCTSHISKSKVTRNLSNLPSMRQSLIVVQRKQKESDFEQKIKQ